MRIVLVEPSRIGRRLLTQLLEQRHYDVVGFSDGLEAYRHIQRDKDVNVLLTSFELPGMNGLELCWEARLLAEQNRQLYIIAMSSSLETDQAILALDSGADDFIRKPPVAEELYAKLRAAQRLAKMHGQLVKLANHDSLTNLLNRREFFKTAQAFLDDALFDTPASAIMLDIDHFKSINDHFGHHIGDIAICAVAKLINTEQGVVGRLGGEEFAILLPIATDVEASERAERLRYRIQDLNLTAEGEKISLTCSFGVSQWHGNSTDTIQEVLKRADDALYQAKNNGRNQVVIAEQDLQFV